MYGTSTKTFDPNMNLTRGMVVTVLHRMHGAAPTGEYKTPFPDVRDGVYYTDAVRWAAANGIVTGYENGLFGPDDLVTREQLAAILYRYQGFSGKKPASTHPAQMFADGDSISPYAKEAVNMLVTQGVIGGKPGNLFDPKGNATRAEYAAMLHRLAN